MGPERCGRISSPKAGRWRRDIQFADGMSRWIQLDIPAEDSPRVQTWSDDPVARAMAGEALETFSGWSNGRRFGHLFQRPNRWTGTYSSSRSNCRHLPLRRSGRVIGVGWGVGDGVAAGAVHDWVAGAMAGATAARQASVTTPMAPRRRHTVTSDLSGRAVGPRSSGVVPGLALQPPEVPRRDDQDALPRLELEEVLCPAPRNRILIGSSLY